MRRSSVARLLAASTVVMLVVGGVSGCFLLPLSNPTGSADKHATAEPSDAAGAGACWETNWDDLAEWASWEGDGPVDCGEAHQSLTFLAEDLNVDVADAFDSEGMTAELGAAASGQCQAEFEDGLGITNEEARVSLYFFVPTEDEWDEGSRAIRCDLAVYAFGSDYYNGEIELEDLPASIDDLLDDLESNEAYYQLCLAGDGAGPYEGTETSIEDCTDGYYYWRYGNLIDFPASETDEYPKGSILYDYGIDNCPLEGMAQGETPYPYIPTPDSWSYGDRSIECWFSTIETPSSAV